MQPDIIQIFHTVPNAGISKKTGNEYDMRMAQCMVEQVDAAGNPAPLIGELLLPKEFMDVPPGRYAITWKTAVGRDKRIGSVVATMTPVGQVKSAPVSPAPAPVSPAPKV